jgi:tRNA-dihydrouridine synthase
MEECGVEALCIHPRSADQFYQGTADHSLTAEVVAAVSIPVVASGDVVSLHAAQTILGATGAAAVMVARGAAGNPWLVDALVAGQVLPRPALSAVVEDLRDLLRLAAQDMGGGRAARWARKLVSWYLRPAGVPVSTIENLRRLPDVATLDAALVALVS